MRGCVTRLSGFIFKFRFFFLSSFFLFFVPYMYINTFLKFPFFSGSLWSRCKHTHGDRDTLGDKNAAAANGGVQIAHLDCYIIFFVFTFYSLLPFSLFLQCSLCGSVRCVRLFPILIVLSLVILSPVPHLSAIIKDPVASYVVPVERRVCISATHLATAPRNYGL